MSVRPTPRLEQRGARLDRRLRVPRRARAAILRLQQVDVAAARDVVRVAGRACPRAIAPLEWQRATADAAGERRYRQGQRIV